MKSFYLRLNQGIFKCPYKSMKRLFIAIPVDAGPDLIRMISSMKAVLGSEKIKWVNTENIHLTLVFLGETEEKKINALCRFLKETCSVFRKFEFELFGSGIFRNWRDPKVIWAGIRSTGELTALNAKITNGLRQIDFAVEDREFSPHLTLGRIKYLRDTETLRSALENYRERQIQQVSVSEVILFESILYSSGPVYKPVTGFHLS